MSKVLTVKSVEGAKPKDVRVEIPDGGCPGLYLIIQPSGAKSWGYRYRFEGRAKKCTLGTFPAIAFVLCALASGVFSGICPALQIAAARASSTRKS